MPMILLIQKPNWIIPVFRQTGLIVEYKRFPADYMWRPFLDLSELSVDLTAIYASIAALEATDIVLADGITDAAALALAAADAADEALAAANEADDTADAAQAAADAAQATADAALASSGVANPTTCRVFADELIYVTGTPSTVQSSAVPYGVSVSTTTDLAACRYWVDLKAGTWEFHFNALKRNDCGRVVISLDSIILENTLDLYAAATNIMFVRSYTGITIPADGRYQLGFTVSGKNGSSAGFVFAPYKFWGRRTGS